MPSGSVRHPHLVVILGMDIKSDFVPRDLLMRKNTDQVSCDGPTVLPTSLLGQLLRVFIQLCRCDVSVFLKILLAADECLFDVAAQLVLSRIVADNVGPPEIRFP